MDLRDAVLNERPGGCGILELRVHEDCALFLYVLL